MTTLLPLQPPVDPRKTPRQARAKATVEAILQAAAHILVARGVEGFNTNAVADRAGVSVGSLYQYFPNKSAIMTEMVRAKRGRLLAALLVAETATRGQGVATSLRVLIAATVRHQRGWPQLAQALDRAAVLLPMHGETEALNQDIHGVVMDVLCRCGAQDCGLAAHDLIGLSRGMIDAAMLRGECDETALVARVVRAALGYLGPQAEI